MQPLRPGTFSSVDACGCQPSGVVLSKAASEPYGSPGHYLGFGVGFSTAEQTQRALDLSARHNSAEFERTYVARDPICGCWGGIAGSETGDSQFEVHNAEVLDLVDVRRVPHETEVRASRGVAAAAAGALLGGLAGLPFGRPGAGAVLGAFFLGGAAAAAPMPEPSRPDPAELGFNSDVPERPAFPLFYAIRPAVILGMDARPVLMR